MTLTLIEGPAGSGKSQIVAQLLDSGSVQIQSDVTAIWSALSGASRGPDGRYPVRLDDDPALLLARYLQRVAVRQALQEGADVAVTTSQRNQAQRWRQLADDAGVPFFLRTLDPGRAVVAARLADDDGELSAACSQAIESWYG